MQLAPDLFFTSHLLHLTSLVPSSAAEASTTREAALEATLTPAAFTVTASFRTAFAALTLLLTCLLAAKGIEAVYHVQHSIVVDAVIPGITSGVGIDGS